MNDLALSDDDLRRMGVRLLKVGMIHPLEPTIVRRFADGLEEILVVEEKRPFLETRIKEVLYGQPNSPAVIGKRNERGAESLPASHELTPELIARAVADRLAPRLGIDLGSRVRRPPSRAEVIVPAVVRTPFFCSGCPHNRSTDAPTGTLVGAGTGCHTMVLLHPVGKGDLIGFTQMGAEGAQWTGIAPFTSTPHLVQNIGDGTFFHSGSLALRAAVAAGVNITFKLLYNDAVAMTGGQRPAGLLPVPELTRLLEVEGVVRTVVTTENTRRYRGVALASNAVVRARDEIVAIQHELAAVRGVTVLLHDQPCAAEQRRLRKRGQRAEPPMRVHINERVCEGCGHCGRVSQCLSVQPVATEFGQKTRIHQSSCNKDYSCLEGDCPSFVTVIPRDNHTSGRTPGARPPRTNTLPIPEPIIPTDSFTIRMPGIGGTGVVTVSRILGMAAHLDRRWVVGLDQTGLSQKGGPVVSDLRISRHPIDGASRLTTGGADLYLAFDPLTAAEPRYLAAADRERTVAVVSTSAVPTGEMVTNPAVGFPGMDVLTDAITHATRSADNVYLDAIELSQRLFGDHLPANLLLLGAAYQQGALPLPVAPIEHAIRLNGGAVEINLAAFVWGRTAVARPEDLPRSPTNSPAEPAANPDIDGLIDRYVGATGELRRLLQVRVADLVAYQNLRYARRYLDVVSAVRLCEQERVPGSSRIAETVAWQLHKLMAYKDEYEVARLHLDAGERAKIDHRFGSGARVRYHLHPPILRALGVKRKLVLGAWFRPVLRLLRAARRLRGTPLDPFGYTRVRRVERVLAGEYERWVRTALSVANQANYEQIVALCELPDRVRGYERIKLAAVEEYRREGHRLLCALGVEPSDRQKRTYQQ